MMTLFFSFVLFFIVATGVTVVAAALGFDIQEPRHQLLSQIVIQLLSFLMPALCVAWLFSESPRLFLKVQSPHGTGSLLLIALLALLTLTPAIDWLTTVNDQWHLPAFLSGWEQSMRLSNNRSQQLVERFLALEGGDAWVLNLLALAVIPPLCEEFFFRGALQQIMMRWIKRPHAAIWITAAIFSLAHGELFAFLPRWVLGALLGYLYYYGASIWINVAVHGLNNALVVVLTMAYNRGALSVNWADSIHAPWYFALAGLLVSGALIWWYSDKSKKYNYDHSTK